MSLRISSTLRDAAFGVRVSTIRVSRITIASSNVTPLVMAHIGRVTTLRGVSGSRTSLPIHSRLTHDGGENIFNLPNGLQAYYLADAGGNRLDSAPIEIVRNLAASDPTVRNGLSCIGCHTEGMKAFEDQVRVVVQRNPNPPFNKQRALAVSIQTKRR